MGVYIKGMAMPKSCLECRLKYEFEELGIWFCSCLSDGNSDTDVSRNGKPLDLRPDYCPLIEIPKPHGRLIDADALKPDILPEWDGIRVPDNSYSLKCVRNAPTVIEAEGSEDE